MEVEHRLYDSSELKLTPPCLSNNSSPVTHTAFILGKKNVHIDSTSQLRPDLLRQGISLLQSNEVSRSDTNLSSLRHRNPDPRHGNLISIWRGRE